MAMRAFYVVLALIGGYLCYEIYHLYSTQQQLVSVEETYISGPEDADLKVVKFLDYTCIYCREAHPFLMEALEADGKISFIPRPISPKSGESFAAATLVYAAGRQGKFFEIHGELMENYQAVDDAFIEAMAKKYGMNAEQLKDDQKSDAVIEQLRSNIVSFVDVGGRGTPTYFIGKLKYEPMDVTPTVDGFLKIFDEARAM